MGPCDEAENINPDIFLLSDIIIGCVPYYNAYEYSYLTRLELDLNLSVCFINIRFPILRSVILDYLG